MPSIIASCLFVWWDCTGVILIHHQARPQTVISIFVTCSPIHSITFYSDDMSYESVEPFTKSCFTYFSNQTDMRSVDIIFWQINSIERSVVESSWFWSEIIHHWWFTTRCRAVYWNVRNQKTHCSQINGLKTHLALCKKVELI